MVSKFIRVIFAALNALYKVIPPSVYYEILLHPLDFAIFLLHMEISLQGRYAKILLY